MNRPPLSSVNSALAILTFLAWIVTGIALLPNLMQRANNLPPPVVIHTFAFEQAQAGPGEEVDIIVDRTAHRCLTPSPRVYEAWVNQDPTKPATRLRRYFEGDKRPMIGSPQGSTRDTLAIPVTVPDEMGLWCYVPKVEFTCNSEIVTLELGVSPGPACVTVR